MISNLCIGLGYSAKMEENVLIFTDDSKTQGDFSLTGSFSFIPFAKWQLKTMQHKVMMKADFTNVSANKACWDFFFFQAAYKLASINRFQRQALGACGGCHKFSKCVWKTDGLFIKVSDVNIDEPTVQLSYSAYRYCTCEPETWKASQQWHCKKRHPLQPAGL